MSGKSSKSSTIHTPSQEQLERAISLAHPGESIEHLETHISHVFLVGPLVYKVKKPVDLGFCDFTKLSHRRLFCHEELRLNCRLAAEIYLDVVVFQFTSDGACELFDTPDVFSYGDADATEVAHACEYAVRMRRFPQDQLLSKLAADKKLRANWFDQLATDLTRFHANAAIAPEHSTAGTHEQVWQPIEECLSSLCAIAELPETRATITEIQSWCQQEHERLRPWFALRKQQGHIRECHGDLHLGNMVLRDDRIVVFDCIEFNDDLRWIDTISDVTFAVMDLQDRGVAHLARRLLSEYLQASDDYESLLGSRFFQVYRSLVRAKVAALRYGQTKDDPAMHSAAADEFQSYLQLAKELAKSGEPWLAIMHGLSGSGKSTIAMRIVEELGAIRIRSDVVRRRQFPDAATRYLPAANELTYQRLQETATEIARASYPAVIDATFLRQAERQTFHDLAIRLSLPFVIIDCTAAPEELRRRITTRMAASDDPSEADLGVLEKQINTQELLTESEAQHVVSVDSSDPQAMGEMAAEIGRRVGSSV